MNRRDLIVLGAAASAAAALPSMSYGIELPLDAIDASHPVIQHLHMRGYMIDVWLDGVLQKDVEAASRRDGWVRRCLHDEDGDIYVDPHGPGNTIAMETVYGRVTERVRYAPEVVFAKGTKTHAKQVT